MLDLLALSLGQLLVGFVFVGTLVLIIIIVVHALMGRR